MTDNPHVGSDALAFLESIVPDTPETQRLEKQERFRIALTQAMRDLRNRVGLTQKELAQRLGIGQSWVSKLESANNDHTFESVLSYLDALDAEFQATVLLGDEKIAVISSNLRSSKSEKPNKNSNEEAKNVVSSSDFPEFEFVSKGDRRKFKQAQSVIDCSGSLWGATEGSAA